MNDVCNKKLKISRQQSIDWGLISLGIHTKLIPPSLISLALGDKLSMVKADCQYTLFGQIFAVSRFFLKNSRKFLPQKILFASIRENKSSQKIRN